jgi:hypothetical protein
VISDGVGIIDSGRNYVVINMRERQSDWEEVKKVVDKAIGAAWTASRGQSEFEGWEGKCKSASDAEAAMSL